MYGSAHGSCFFNPLSERDEIFTLFPMGGYLTNFLAFCDFAIDASHPVVITFRRNGQDTNFTMTFTNVIWRIDSNCMFRVEQGDRVSLKVHSTQAPTVSASTKYKFNMGYTFIPDTGGEWPLMYVSQKDIS